ncbi:hypothetical protein VCRA2117O380_30307 [Vibrio crassostreae]|nr:hypothetical protein VCRA2110O182_10135 [Vibrio crassostreae]CAK2052389.1 hypothetical protein VCRA2119O381_410025 [Vibrio crassostreae]CAK2065818.1 hypothetical protein VCRA2117O379_30307 [Vibrio crassostreae]CAK2066951.1 hypothetical protein VCRA2119O382_30307 [Vibrio crassostreae]CAK2069784.1 hypothetical protein VCRA2117O380_30307 [Vibrio crassostreae]
MALALSAVVIHITTGYFRVPAAVAFFTFNHRINQFFLQSLDVKINLSQRK